MRAILVKAGAAAMETVADPAPGEGEALIRVRLSGICSTDLEIIRGYGGFEGVLGHEFVGEVVGGSARLLGKRVVGEINCVCGRCDMCQSGLSTHCRRRTVMGIAGRPGCHAEYVVLPERNCLIVPDSVSDDEAVFTEPLAAAFQVLRQAKIEKRTSAAVIGTGRLGLLVAQVLGTTGCRLMAIGRNPKTIGLLDRRGINAVMIDAVRDGQAFDVVVDCTGEPDGLREALRLIRPRGTIVMKTTCQVDHSIDLTPLVVNEITLLGSRCGPFGEALSALARKQIDVSEMITRKLPLAEATRALELAADADQIKVVIDYGR